VERAQNLGCELGRVTWVYTVVCSTEVGRDRVGVAVGFMAEDRGSAAEEPAASTFCCQDVRCQCELNSCSAVLIVTPHFRPQTKCNCIGS
jgi:hypothetical protein